MRKLFFYFDTFALNKQIVGISRSFCHERHFIILIFVIIIALFFSGLRLFEGCLMDSFGGWNVAWTGSSEVRWLPRRIIGLVTQYF
jgi:hypothetical protein